MIDPQILARARALLATGVSADGLKQVLHIEGLNDTDIAEVIAVLAPSQTPSAPLQPTSNITTAPPQQFVQQAPPPARKKSHAGIFVAIFIFLLLCAGGAAGAYAYYEKLGPFAKLPYAESNLISGLIDSTSKIRSGAYKITASLSVVARDTDAVAFSVQTSNAEGLRQKYANDSKRLSSVSAIVNLLKMYGRPPYPATLQAAINKALVAPGASYLRMNMSSTDPGTDLPYQYRAVNGGKDFEITVNFETRDAIDALNRYSKYASSTTKLHDLTATFSSGSNSYAYLSPEPPKPFLVMLGEYMRMVPAQMSASLSAGAATDWGSGAGEWKFNVDATGDFGDLTYKIDADALKKGQDYYFRVNNFPSFFAEFLAGMKGTWIKISPNATSSMATAHNEFSFIASSLPDQEKKYKENREKLTDFARKVTKFADEEQLIRFRNEPSSERVDGRLLYKYELRLNKSAILPFYKKMYDEAQKNDGVEEYNLFNDPGTVQYLQSDEFSQVFDYLDKNTLITLWVDEEGNPAEFAYTMRVVPPDTAEQLKDKQVMLTIKLEMSGINQPVTIDAPTDAKSIEEISQKMENNLSYSLDDARTKGRDARRVADIKQLQLALELYYDKHSEYPGSLDALAKESFISAIPKDPQTNASYIYSALGGAKCSGYHLGAPLEATNSTLSNDSDAKPAAICKKSLHADFNGDSVGCSSSKSAPDRCYDVKS